MQKKTIKELKKLVAEQKLTNEDMQMLKQDTRKGVIHIVKQYEQEKQKEQELMKHFYEMCHYERQAFQKGFLHIAGMDEAGRGPLAGPVVAASVILPNDFYLPGLDDSKQLSEKKRQNFFTKIKEQALSYGIACVDNHTIDQINILNATKMAMKKAILMQNIVPDYLLIDAVQLNDFNCPQESIIKGDAKSVSIAAASILAKVTRDQLMQQIHQEYPNYGFSNHMGYGTKKHLEALNQYGATPYHRKSFAPVRQFLG